jgi:hypothetical protein
MSVSLPLKPNPTSCNGSLPVLADLETKRVDAPFQEIWTLLRIGLVFTVVQENVHILLLVMVQNELLISEECRVGHL